MPNPFEKGPERTPTREEILSIIGHYLASPEKATVTQELSDEQGIYMLEVKVEGPEPGESTEFRYTRKGEFPNQIASAETIIQAIYYQDDIPVGGENIASYTPETVGWEEIKKLYNN